MPRSKHPARLRPPVRLHEQDGRFYWKPEKRLRPAWRTTPLGADAALAAAEARRLNKLVDDWLKTERPQTAPRRAQPRTVGELIELWRHGPMQDKAPRTRKQYDYELNRLAAEFGHEPAFSLSAERVDAWADPLRKTAPSSLRVIAGRGRSIFHWAGRKTYIPRDVNPFREMNLPSGGKRKKRVTWQDVQHLVRVAAKMELASLGHAFACGFLTIQRIYDVLALTEDDIETERRGAELVRSLRFRQSKSGFEVDQEWPDELDEMLGIGPHFRPRGERKRRTPRGQPTAAIAPGARPLFVSERSGLAWNEKYASRLWAKIIAAAISENPGRWHHLRGVQLRDCRRSGFVHCNLNGARVELICSMSGHTIEQGLEIIEHYLPKTREAADQARVFMRKG